ncbi:hypothetical protein [Cognaticolwellia mytili]|uniref:hypothetical protein n=1 Tax=Cognaticolwellia mytili TaxID=1888913 RepID=UPI000A178502|nr:hypothetical protein [Cognaticolwellia mytili]
MKFYYVRDNGTDFTGSCTGEIGNIGGASDIKRVGAWDANSSKSFVSIKAVFDAAVNTELPDNFSVVFVASDHVENHVGNIALNVGTVSSDKSVLIISTSIVDYSYQPKAARINCTGNISVGKRASKKTSYKIKGLVISMENGSIDANTHLASEAIFEECIILQPNARFSSRIAVFKNCELTYFRLESIDVSFVECKMTNTFSGYHFRNSTLTFYRCDFSEATTMALSGTTGGIVFHQCKMPNLPIVGVSTYRMLQPLVELNGCSISDVNKYYNYYVESSFYILSTISDVYLHYQYDEINSASLLVETKSICNKIGNGRAVKVIELCAQDLSVKDTTYRVNLLLNTDTVNALTDTDFWVDLALSSNDALTLGHTVSTRLADNLAIGTELKSSDEIWQGPSMPVNFKAYCVDITLTAADYSNVSNTNIVINANLVVPNADVYICPAVQIGT